MEEGKESVDISKCFSPKEIYQELITINNGSVPEPFFRHDQQRSTTDPSPLSVPLIDLIGFASTTNLVEKLHSACKDWGFFLVVNHGIDEQLLQRLKFDIEKLFELPLAEKEKYRTKTGEAEGYGQNLTTSSLQQPQQLDWADRFYMITNPLSLRKPHLFPMLPPSLRESLEAYLEQLEKLGTKLLLWMAEALGIDKGEVEELFRDGMRSLRMNYYPPCPNPEHVVGISPHSDATLLTMLLQLNGVGGLEVIKDGRWIPVHVPPNSLVVNVGDMMEIVSNGAYKSVEHRVTVNPKKERMSMAVFCSPNLDAQLGPSTSLITPSNPPLFKTIPIKKYVEDYFTNKLHGKSYLDKMRITDLTTGLQY